MGDSLSDLVADVENVLDIIEFIDSIEDIEKERTRLPKRYIRNSLDPFNVYRDDEFKLRFRFTKETVRTVLYPLVQHLEKNDNRGLPVSPMIKLLLTLRFYATGNLQLMSGDLCGVSRTTTCAAIHTVTEIFAGKLREHINLPSTRAETAAAKQWFKRTGGFPGVVAAVGRTHIPILNPGGERSEAYRNRHDGAFSINVQVACGANLKIVDIVARRPGSFHDAMIFKGSGLKTLFEQGRVEGILLGDSGYPCLPYLLTPLSNAQTEAEQRYNAAHIATHNSLAQLFGLWKRRFRCLTAKLETKPHHTVAIIVATAVLHNISIDVDEAFPGDEMPWIEEEHGPLPPMPGDNNIGRHAREDYIRSMFN